MMRRLAVPAFGILLMTSHAGHYRTYPIDLPRSPPMPSLSMC